VGNKNDRTVSISTTDKENERLDFARHFNMIGSTLNPLSFYDY
jgi:hypothetical protein